MHIVLWDTRKGHVAKDFAGGFGVGSFQGKQGGLRGRIVGHLYSRDRRPVALAYAYLAASFSAAGHQVSYSLDETPTADCYIFNPALMTLPLELAAMRDVRRKSPTACILVIGAVAHAMPEAFAEIGVTVVRGEAEQLHWKLDEALQAEGSIDVGIVAELDALPFPDWRPFQPKGFRVRYDFTQFPTAYIQQSRGCTFTCNYCPYILLEHKTRFRSPESVVAEIVRGQAQHGFRSFKFRDPLFGLSRSRTMELADLIRRLPFKIQFSIEGRIDLLRVETLQELRSVGLTSVTIGVETPDEETLRKHHRTPIRDDRQREFIADCRRLGIRTVAGFMVGFPGDTARSIHAVLRYAKQLNPTYANFNVVTPYPGTAYYQLNQDQIADQDVSHYDVYTPVMKYEHLTSAEVARLHARCFGSFYFRWKYLRDNARLLWPWMQRLSPGVAEEQSLESHAAHGALRPSRRPPTTRLPRELRKDSPHPTFRHEDRRGSNAS